jgi:hypothetical protein
LNAFFICYLKVDYFLSNVRQQKRAIRMDSPFFEWEPAGLAFQQCATLAGARLLPLERYELCECPDNSLGAGLAFQRLTAR